MRNLNYELIVNRGESFTLDFEVVNQDGSPYIVYSKLENPHVLITIWSINNQVNPYKCVYWLNLNDLPKFEYTRPLEVQDFTAYPPKNKDGTSYEDLGFEDDELTGKIAVFVHTDKKGNKVYKYWNNGEYVDYTFRIIKYFTPIDTYDLTSQNYNYSVQLVSGYSTKDSEVPINYFKDVTVILPATKLTVLNNKLGGLNDYK